MSVACDATHFLSIFAVCKLSLNLVLFRNNRVATMPTGTYIYTKHEILGRFSKYLAYNFLIWYISQIWYIFGLFLSEGVFEILNQFIWFVTKRKQKNR